MTYGQLENHHNLIKNCSLVTIFIKSNVLIPTYITIFILIDE